MKIVEINSCDYGSTGKIMLQIADEVRKNGGECRIVIPEGRHNPWKNNKDYFRFGNRLAEDLHIFLGYLTGYQGCFSVISTIMLVKKLKKYNPDILHLHNLHKCYINLPILFNYIKSQNIRTIWTLHDCWAFTGQCPHFVIANCDKWKTGCHHCSHINNYPSSLVDRTKTMWKLKNKWFTGVKCLTIVTPSKWLAGLVKQSYLKEYPVTVINNGIDLGVFKPTENDFRDKYNLENKHILLGVSFGWNTKKGLDVFIELAKRLDNHFKIVLVGTNDEIDKNLPDNIISIHKTSNQEELAQIYSAADLFINPTREENYPTVNMESIACGTPVLTFRTGGSPEILDKKTGDVVDVDDIDEMERQILQICNENKFSADDCLERAKSFDKNLKYKEYIKLFKR